ncbi:hypothetical protein TrVE_jg8585 [Triparma verrucosa]|uniref:Uncharacterized protein n=1 Tax=Triparma verrucosa TaxID=1606542 RepID=A0A9W7FGI5_9STRA|nr:hypothetical protein TrVE_jg8585 [Triparma verrucosa]
MLFSPPPPLPEPSLFHSPPPVAQSPLELFGTPCQSAPCRVPSPPSSKLQTLKDSIFKVRVSCQSSLIRRLSRSNARRIDRLYDLSAGMVKEMAQDPDADTGAPEASSTNVDFGLRDVNRKIREIDLWTVDRMKRNIDTLRDIDEHYSEAMDDQHRLHPASAEAELEEINELFDGLVSREQQVRTSEMKRLALMNENLEAQNKRLLSDLQQSKRAYQEHVRNVKDNVVLKCLNSFRMMYTQEGGGTKFESVEVKMDEAGKEVAGVSSQKICNIMNELLEALDTLEYVTHAL